MASFWDNIGPGLIQTGGNYAINRMGSKDAEDRMRRAQGPLYDQQQRLAGQALNLAQGMDPNAMAADRFKQQQALVAPGNEADLQSLMRQLQAKGMLDVASYGPVAGTVSQPGVAMNPQMAALFAAQAGAREKASFDSLREGQDYLDQTLNRAGMLQRQSQGARASGQQAMLQVPPKPSLGQDILRGGMGILKDKQGRDAIMAAIKGAPEFVRNLPTSIPGMFGDLKEWLSPTQGLSDTDWGF